MKILLSAAALLGGLLPMAAAAGIRAADVKAAAIEFAGDNAAAVEMKATDDGKIWLAAQLASGLKYVGEFYNCDAANTECERLSLVIAFLDTGADVADLNPWNQERFPQAFSDEDGDPNLQLFTLASEAYGMKSLRALLTYWSGECELFQEFVYEAGETTKVSAPLDVRPHRVRGPLHPALKNDRR